MSYYKYKKVLSVLVFVMDLREVQRPLLTWLLSFVRFKRQSFLEGAGLTLVLPYVIYRLLAVWPESQNKRSSAACLWPAPANQKQDIQRRDGYRRRKPGWSCPGEAGICQSHRRPTPFRHLRKDRQRSHRYTRTSCFRWYNVCFLSKEAFGASKTLIGGLEW